MRRRAMREGTVIDWPTTQYPGGIALKSSTFNGFKNMGYVIIALQVLILVTLWIG